MVSGGLSGDFCKMLLSPRVNLFDYFRIFFFLSFGLKIKIPGSEHLVGQVWIINLITLVKGELCPSTGGPTKLFPV